MSLPVTLEDLMLAAINLQVIGTVVEGDAYSDVTTPQGRVYSTLAKALRLVVENGLLGATPFTTKALMQASSLAVDSYAIVTRDTVSANNGFYQKDSAGWTYLAWNPLKQAVQAVSDEMSKIATTVLAKNLYNPAAKVPDKYIVSSTGFVRNQVGWGIAVIPVVAGQQVTISSNAARRAGATFFSDNTLADASYIAGSYVDAVTTASTSATLTVPAGATVLCINMYSTTVAEPTQVQVELGATATAYTPYVPSSIIIKDEVLPSVVVRLSQIPALVAKVYEKAVVAKNLFNKNNIIDGKYLNSTTGNIMTAAGWGMSAEIAVTAGQQYTISGTRGRSGIAFFADAMTTTALSYDGSTANPRTVTAPAGANFMRINLYSSTATTYSNVQVELGSTATSYDPTYGNKLYVLKSMLYDDTGTGVSAVVMPTITLDVANTAASVKTTVDGNAVQHDVVWSKSLTHNTSSVFNFTKETFNGVVLRSLSDDVAPLRAMGVTIGANHGYSKTTVTASNHGRTAADVGSVWTSSGQQWIITDVLTSSTFVVTARYSNDALLANAVLTSVANTAITITATAVVESQWFPVIKNRTIGLALDGKPATFVDGTFEFRNNATFREYYEIMAKNDIVEWLILNGGVAVMQYDAASTIGIAHTYTFDIDGGCLIKTEVRAIKSFTITDFMLTQSIKMTGGVGAALYYVPKSIAFTQGGVDYNFSQLTDIGAKAPAASIDFNAAKQAAGMSAVDRLLQFNQTAGYATGFVPVLDAAPDVRVNSSSGTTNIAVKALQIRNSSHKIYPALVDGIRLANGTIKTTLAAGESFVGYAYRKLLALSTDRTAKYVVRTPFGAFLYVDWHNTVKLDTVPLPPDLFNKEFVIHERSPNVEVVTRSPTNSVTFNVTASQDNTFAVLRFP